MWCVRWYLRYPISVAQTYGAELDNRCRPYLKPTNRSWYLGPLAAVTDDFGNAFRRGERA